MPQGCFTCARPAPRWELCESSWGSQLTACPSVWPPQRRRVRLCVDTHSVVLCQAAVGGSTNGARRALVASAGG
jgi:hypothetical protein